MKNFAIGFVKRLISVVRKFQNVAGMYVVSFVDALNMYVVRYVGQFKRSVMQYVNAVRHIVRQSEKYASPLKMLFVSAWKVFVNVQPHVWRNAVNLFANVWRLAVNTFVSASK